MKLSVHIQASLSLLALAILFLASCKPTQHLKEGEYLVVKNVIHLESGIQYEDEAVDSNASSLQRTAQNIKNQGKKAVRAKDPEPPEVTEDELEGLLRQKPNRKLFGVVRFHLAAWNTGERIKKKDSKMKNLLQNIVGEEPVIFEQTLFERSTSQIEKYMKNSGYFRTMVEADTIVKRKKKLELHYYVKSGPAYRLRRWTFALEDTTLRQLIKEKELNSDLNRGDRFDAGMFEEERDRLTLWMKDHGYYTFEKVHVVFDIDTNISGYRYDVAVRLRNLRTSSNLNGRDTLLTERHVKYKLRNIYINPTYDLKQSDAIPTDTIERRGYSILFRGRTPMRPFRLVRTMRIAPEDLYSTENTQSTYNRLQSLNNFRYIDIQYDPVDGDDPMLDAHINLSMAPKQSITFEATGTNRSGNLGISGSVNYQNKNLFRGAERFNVRFFGGLEAQQTVTETSNGSEVIETYTPFNTFQIGVETRVDIPDFIFKKTAELIKGFKEPQTSVGVTLDRQLRPDYQRDLLNTTYSYSGKFGTRDLFTLAIADISLIRLDKDPEFEERLQSTNNSLLINSYNDHLISASRASYSFSTQDFENELKNYFYFKANLEGAGNMARFASNAFGGNYVDSTDSYTISGIRFAQYVKLDLDFVKVNVLNKSSDMVYRFYGGVGIPLTNLNALPFDRSFYGGGSNGIRAWNIRTLGPGSAADTAVYGIDQVGEMHLEFNLEYRFGLTDIIEGAVFSDIGNIWLLRYDPQRPNAEFDLTRVYEDLAISPGIGLRLNFNFFIIRLDWGVQLRNPNLPKGERWAFQPKDLTNQYREEASQVRIGQGLESIPSYNRVPGIINLAIGYPF